jgi:carboxyl-terminal processing protease
MPDIEVLASREDQAATQRATREREADLRRALRNEGGVPQPEAAAPPPLTLPGGLQERIQRLPPEGFAAFDAAKPETDFQLQQALVLLRGLAAQAVPVAPQRRAAGR